MLSRRALDAGASPSDAAPGTGFRALLRETRRAERREKRNLSAPVDSPKGPGAGGSLQRLASRSNLAGPPRNDSGQELRSITKRGVSNAERRYEGMVRMMGKSVSLGAGAPVKRPDVIYPPQRNELGPGAERGAARRSLERAADETREARPPRRLPHAAPAAASSATLPLMVSRWLED